MAALTQAQWLAKIRKFVPAWYFEKKDGLTESVFLASAAVFQQIQQDTDDAVAATYLKKSTYPILDTAGSERGKERNDLEPDSEYVDRIQRITSSTDYSEIKAAIDKILINGKCVIRDGVTDSPYADRGSYADMDYYTSDFKYGQYFMVVVLPQKSNLFSFADAHYYADWDYAGSLDESSSIYGKIIALIDSLKAGGIVYRVAVSRHSAIY